MNNSLCQRKSAMNDVAPTSALAASPGTTDPDELQLPMAGLFADLELGAGSVLLPDEFSRSPALVQLKVIGHWQRSLVRYRHAALRRFARELSKGSPEMDDAGRIAADATGDVGGDVGARRGRVAHAPPPAVRRTSTAASTAASTRP